ncbi:MAG TPA: hypothetical protein VGD68_09255 [Streptosporangiaceae bacterium]
MPRDQETSFGRNLFRKRDDQSGDQPADEHGDPQRDPSDTPGEWVAGPHGPGNAADDGPVVPGQASWSSVESTDPVTGDTGANGAASPDPLAGHTTVQDGTPAPGATDSTEFTDAPGAIDSTGAGDFNGPQVTGGTLAASDAGGASTSGVGPGGEVTPDTGFPVQDATSAPEATGTGPDPATAPAAATESGATGSGATGSGATGSGATGSRAGTAVPGAPGTGSTTALEAASASLITNGAELHDDWARIQSSFVDDPRASVSEAADLVAQVTGSLVSAVQERERTLRGEWDGRSDSDTENLRNALRGYRAFFELLIKL